MSSASMGLPTLVKRSITWSITLSVLMIVAGFLAIVVPPVAGLAVTILVGWLLVFSGIMHFVFAWHMRGTVLIIWEILLGIVYVLAGGYVLLVHWWEWLDLPWVSPSIFSRRPSSNSFWGFSFDLDEAPAGFSWTAQSR
jgi:uncharacterized membrane protein HdeD (DUF308 family)